MAVLREVRVVTRRLLRSPGYAIASILTLAFAIGANTAMAFLLATVGLISVVSLDVVHRSREFAVRLALGADRSDIQSRVLRSVGRRLLAGMAAGLLVAGIASRWLGSLLFDVDRFDPVTYGTVVAVVSLAVTAAAFVPARRAAGIEPATLFRAE